MNRTLCSILLILGLALFLLMPRSISQEGKDTEFDWFLTLSSEEVKDYFKFPGTLLTPIVKVHVAVEKDKETKPYETLLYTGNKAIGCQRENVLAVPRSGLGLMRIATGSNTVSPNEIPALANAIIRVLLDARMLGNAPFEIRLPSNLYDQTKQTLGHYHFLPYDKGRVSPQDAAIMFLMTSDPQGQREYMYLPK